MNGQITASKEEFPKEAQDMLDLIETNKEFAGGLFYGDNAKGIMQKPWAKDVLLAAVRRNPACALSWFSKFDAPFAAELFDEAARRDPITLLEIAMEGHPRFDKIRELIWKFINRDPQHGGTLWRVEGKFVTVDMIQELVARKVESARRIVLSDVLKEIGL
ncbi:hypothetical protein HYW83_06490 [Candidatus Peregrinibacteria bacterium]|nr:hypothetical protein [Candidatus Peregrinibacteria bacterium]